MSYEADRYCVVRHGDGYRVLDKADHRTVAVTTSRDAAHRKARRLNDAHRAERPVLIDGQARDAATREALAQP